MAAICRNDQGGFIAASAMVIPHITDPETLEAMACLEALALAEDCGIRSFVVALDCLNVVKNIREMPRCSYMMILQDIHQRSKSFSSAQFAHEGRNFNREAHMLVKFACTLGSGRYIWLKSPPILVDVNTSKVN